MGLQHPRYYNGGAIIESNKCIYPKMLQNNQLFLNSFSILVKDLEAAYHITDIHEALALSEVGNDRKMFLFGTQVTESGSDIPSIMQDARDLIAQLAADTSNQA